ncbi:MAG: carboxypeptidase-like regulatory domain-containing protein [Candidatus Cryosericum sp.]
MRRGAVLLLLLSLVFAVGCGKQAAPSGTGSIHVTVEDQNGGVIKGATLTLTDGTGKTTTASSDSAGKASFADLLSGDYKLKGSADGYATNSTSLNVTGGDQESTLTLTPAQTSNPSGETADKHTFDGLSSYRWTFASTGANGVTQKYEGAFEKPDREYIVSGTGSGRTEIYKVGTAVKMRSGTAGKWNTVTGDTAQRLVSLHNILFSALAERYSSITKEGSGFVRSDGGTVNGYSTQKYVLATTTGGTVTNTTAWVIDRGAFSGIITRWVSSETTGGKTTSITWAFLDLNRPAGIKLP